MFIWQQKSRWQKYLQPLGSQQGPDPKTTDRTRTSVWIWNSGASEEKELPVVWKQTTAGETRTVHGADFETTTGEVLKLSMALKYIN